jgi:ATP-binding cassette, subfamily B, bacterial MsbA
MRPLSHRRMSTPLLQRLARIAPYFRTARPGFVAAFGAAAVAAATEPLVPEILKRLLDGGFGPQRTFALWHVPVAFIGLFALRGLASFVAQYALAWSANRGVLTLREKMFERLLNAAPALYSERSASSLTNTVVYEVQTGARQLVQIALTLVRDSLIVVFLLASLIWRNWQLTLFILVLAPAVAVVMRLVSKRLDTLTRAHQAATDDLAYVVEENVAAWRIVRLHGAARTQSQRFEKTSQWLRRLLIKSAVAGATSSPLTQLIASVAVSAVVVLALWQAGQPNHPQAMTVGEFTAYITAMLMLVTPLKHLADSQAPLLRGVRALERGIDLIENAPEERGGTHAPVSGRARGAIELRGVTLAYRSDADAAPALDDVTLSIDAGQTVALVGPSGAGKTSLVNLLPRFFEPTRGEVLLDGVALPQWQLGALRQQFALVSQEVVLFNDTVAANIALGAAIDAARVRSALESANLLGFVLGLPQGVDSPIGHNGNQLSGGQRQRLAIARAIYKDAPVLILDEATSALDSESERAVQDALERLMRGRTTVVIAHRLSTIEHADRVVVMERGRIAEQGTHAHLLASGGLYARLHALQFGTATS